MTDSTKSAKEEKSKKSIFKDPLFQFFIIGLLIYGLYFVFADTKAEEDEYTLIVSKGEVAWMVDTWEKRWNRPPSEQELDALINQHIEESILYKEAVKMGLDNDDVIIRRRLAQKLRFLQEDLMQAQEPSPEELEAYFEKNIGDYKAETLITFTQIFFNPDDREESTLIDAENVKSELNNKLYSEINPSNYGDRFMLQNYYPKRTELQVTKLFGSEFTKSIMDLDVDVWHGPILSGYGTHIVYVDEYFRSGTPELAQVKEQVVEDWKKSKQEEINALFMESLKAQYTIILEEDEV